MLLSFQRFCTITTYINCFHCQKFRAVLNTKWEYYMSDSNFLDRVNTQGMDSLIRKHCYTRSEYVVGFPYQVLLDEPSLEKASSSIQR